MAYINYQMSNILQKTRNIYNSLKFKVASIYKGEFYSAVQTSLAFNQKFKQKQRVALKYQSYPELNRYFIQFLNSAESAGRVNGDNLAFLIGALGGGKSSYVENNIQKFKQLKAGMADRNKKIEYPQIHRYKTPQYIQNQTKETVFQNEHFLIFNFNLQKSKAANFSTFIHDIHEQIINQIVRLDKKLSGTLLDCETIKEILSAQNSQQYLYNYIKDVLYCMLNDTDILLLSENAKKQLNIVNSAINQGKVQASQFFSKNHFKQVINIIVKDLKINEAEATLRLFLSVGKRIQYQNRPETHLYSWYETGIQSTNILFDILNSLCGFGKLNKNIFDQYYFGQNNSVQTPPNANKLSLDSYRIKTGSRIDVGMFFLNMSELYIYDTVEFWNFIDHLIARTSNASGLRTHFPLMIQFPNFSDFEDMHNMGQFDYSSPVVVELPGYTLQQIILSNANVAQVFTEKILVRLFYTLGRNPLAWNKALIELSNGNAKIQNIIKMDAAYIGKEAIKVQAKINNIFTSSQILPQLCDGSARYQLIQHLRLLHKAKGLILVDRPGYYIDFYTRPIFKLLLKENLLYEHYYLPYIDISELTNKSKMSQIKNTLLSGHIWSFFKWRWSNLNRFNIIGRQAMFQHWIQKQSYNYDEFRKRRTDPLLAETYYGAKFSYIFHYREKGIEVEIIG